MCAVFLYALLNRRDIWGREEAILSTQAFNKAMPNRNSVKRPRARRF